MPHGLKIEDGKYSTSTGTTCKSLKFVFAWKGYIVSLKTKCGDSDTAATVWQELPWEHALTSLTVA
jgi:RNA polymerase subunit RPABC4/transcription elongation factor Spt4